MADLIASAAAAAAVRKVSPFGKPAAGVHAMRSSLPALTVARVSGPNMDIHWEDFNYPSCFPLIHFDISELQYCLRKTVRLLNMSFLLTALVCLVNVVDTAILTAVAGVPGRWLLQSVLHVALLPPAQFAAFYLGYRGLATTERVLLRRFQFFQLVLCVISVFFAAVSFQCINGLLRLVLTEEGEGAGAFGALVVCVESFLWMLNACLGLLNIVMVRKASKVSSHRGTYSSPPAKIV